MAKFVHFNIEGAEMDLPPIMMNEQKWILSSIRI